MFTSRGLFSEIACPYYNTCQLPKCLFWHPESTPQANPSVTKSEEIVLDNGDERPRKKQKVDENQHLNGNGTYVPKLAVEVGGRESARPSATAANARGQRRVPDPNRPISPPPVLRKSQLSTSSNETKPINKSISDSAQRTPMVEAGRPVVKPRLKQEDLNPRLIKGPAPNTHGIRLKLIKMLHIEFIRLNSELRSDANDEEEQLVLSDQEVITKALDLEESAAATPSIYSNIVKGKIGYYKKLKVSQWKDERLKEVAQQKAAEAAISATAPQLISKTADPEPPKIVVTGLTTEDELRLLWRLLTPVKGLAKHGYVNTIPTEDDIDSANKGVEAAMGWEICDRCKSRFQVFPGRREEDGALASGGICIHHWGKPYTVERSSMESKGKRERRYKCCNELLGDSTGCTKTESHVFKISEVKRMASVLNFEKTPENPGTLSGLPVCIDGEMGYTVYGLELIRLTATSWPNGEELFDVLVRPVGEIMDLNSRFSGVWPKDFAEATPYDVPLAPYTTPPPPPPRGTSSLDPKLALAQKRQLRKVSSPAVARTLLFSYLTPRTPLIGHGLENDLNATRVIHPTIIDTALLFPHKAGLPYRNGLKALMLQHLNRHVQVVVDGKMEGHDSMEDANAAGELVRYKLAEEWKKMKRDGWTLEDGTFKAPGGNDGQVPMGTPTSLKGIGTPTGPKVGALGTGHASTSVAGSKRPRDETELEDGEFDG